VAGDRGRDTEVNRRQGPLTDEQRQTFLDALRDGSTAKAAAQEASRERRRFYELRETDEAFAAEWKVAWEEGTDVLEQEARRRAVDGVIYSESYDKDGNLVGRVTRYSDTLLIFLLKSRDPARFNRFEITGPAGKPVQVEVDLADPDRLARVASILAGAGALRAGGEPHPEA
jgi:hypothetical protein